jgi:pyrroloquinoline quinone biosynthesis protein B
VLGSAAGGGFPQWNCNCPNCAGYRSGSLKARARTQSSIAVARWVLVNASPDIRAQLQGAPELQPNRSLRDSALCGIVLVDGQVDHTTGLYMLRESTRPWPIWCTDSTYADLTRGNPILGVLRHFCGVDRRRIELDREFAIDELTDVRWRALPVASKPAVYAPGLAAIDERLSGFMRSAACVLVDGTFWSDDEMVRVGVSGKRARDIGHLPQSGPGGMLEQLDRLPAGVRKILIHINNTNPILDELSAEFGELRRRGIEVAEDGMEISL